MCANHDNDVQNLVKSRLHASKSYFADVILPNLISDTVSVTDGLAAEHLAKDNQEQHHKLLTDSPSLQQMHQRLQTL